MRFARVMHDGVPRHALVEGDALALVDDVFAREPTRTGKTVGLTARRLLAPVAPLLVVGMAHNTGPLDRQLPPAAFLKPPRSVIGPGDPLALPSGVGRVDAEGELAVVIGRHARHLTVRDALDAVLGYTVANDVTARDLQQRDPLWGQAKGFDGFTPLGPWIETDLDPQDAIVTLRVTSGSAGQNSTGQNSTGQRPARRSSASTSDLARDVVEVLVYLTSYMTLGPGDVVLAGAPGASIAVRAGDAVAVSVEGIGTLTTPVVSAAPARKLAGVRP